MFVPRIATIVPLMFCVMLMGLLSSIAIGEQVRVPEPMQEKEVGTNGCRETWKSWIGLGETKPQTDENKPKSTPSKEQKTAKDEMAENRRWLEEDHPIGCEYTLPSPLPGDKGRCREWRVNMSLWNREEETITSNGSHS